jgi:tetratricopeptide (TPR) repeat protein
VNPNTLSAGREHNVRLAFQAAMRLDRDGHWRDAEQHYRSVLAFAPNHLGALDRLGALCARTGKLEDALALLRRAVEADANGIDVRLRLGAVLLLLKRPAEAQIPYCQALALRADCADAHCGLGDALRAQSRTSDAMTQYQRAIAIRPDFADAHRGLGHTLMALNRPEQALAHYRAVLALRPDELAIHTHLGNASMLLNRLKDAIAHYEKAAATAARSAGHTPILAWLKRIVASTHPGRASGPDLAKAHRNLGLLLLALRRPEEASVQLRLALRLAPDDADTHRDLADLLQTRKRHAEALAHYHEALAIRPDDATVLLHLANALAQQGRFAEAAAHYERLLTINPDDADGHGHLGNALFALKRPESAIAHYQTALVLAPGRAEFHNNLGIALQALGRVEEACSAYERALQAAPRQTTVHLNLAIAKPFASGDSRLPALEALAQNLSALDEEQQIALHFALGKAFADLKAPERSSHHWLAGNAHKRRTIAYDEAATLGLLRHIRATFTSDLMAQKRGGGAPSRTPIFVVGMPRSGTTLIEQILASHSKVFGAGELEAFPAAAADVIKAVMPEAIATVSHETLQQLGERYLSAVARSAAPAPLAERIVDKLPTNFLSLGLIHLALPNARIIHVCRDPVDTCLSCFSILFAGPVPYSYELGELGRYYRAYEQLMAHWRSVLPPGVMIDVRYEDVVSDLEAQTRRMLAHCGLAWEDACLAFHQTRRLVRTASSIQVRQPLYRTAIGRWRPYQDLLGPLWQALGRVPDQRASS